MIILSIFLENGQNTSAKSSKTGKSKGNAKQAKQPQKLTVKVSSKHTFSHSDLLCSFKGHTEEITSAAVSHNGKGLVTASEGNIYDIMIMKHCLGVGGWTNCWQNSFVTLIYNYN